MMTPQPVYAARREASGSRSHRVSRALVVSAACLLFASGCGSRSRFDRGIPKTGLYTPERAANTGGYSGDYPRLQEPELLGFDELVELSGEGRPASDTPLGDKVDRLLSTPLIDNGAWYGGERPRWTRSSKLGPVLRMATWNIKKSLRMPEIIAAMRSEEAYREMISDEVKEDGETWNEMLRQRERLVSSDILFLQEMDIGVNRSDYANAAKELAEAMDMNYAYVTQALEVDPVLLGLEPVTQHEGSQADLENPDFLEVDRKRFKGSFGSAVLSRYPIKHVEVIPLETVAYDWWADEKEQLSLVESARRFGAEVVFENVLAREMKVGGRSFFRVDLEVPGIAENDTLTVINVHLEIKCLPEKRIEQLREILSYAEDIPNPVVMAGDFNSSPSDVSPTAIPRITWRFAKDPTTWLTVANQVAFNFDGAGLIRAGVNFAKNLNSPLAPHIPIILPNEVRLLFDELRDFRFADDTAFDFRGDAKRSMGLWHGYLSNSNQKQLKGRVPSFSLQRPVGPIGHYRLDWFFVRSGLLTDPEKRHQSYRLAPHFGETLKDFNVNLKQPFSDHRPLVVDLPLTEPDL